MGVATQTRDLAQAGPEWTVIPGGVEVAGEPTDWDLLARTRTDRPALELLYRRHRDYVFRVAWGLSGDRVRAADAVQEVFTRLAAKRFWFTPRAQFRTWLYKVTLNVTREERRAAVRFHTPPLDYDAVDEHGGSHAEREARLGELQSALAQLPQRQREVVVMRYLEGLSTAETAAVLGCREGTVKAHLHRAAQALTATLDGEPAVPVDTELS